MRKLQAPSFGGRTMKTIISATIIAILYSFFDRSACFACIGAVFGMGSHFRGGLQSGGNRFIGTLIGGIVALPFYSLYHQYGNVVPQWMYLSVGLLLLTMICQIFGVQGGIQPGAVVFFVVIYTVSSSVHISYVIARILDTGLGVAFSLLISWIWPSPIDARSRAIEKLEDEGKRLLLIEKDIESMKDYKASLERELNSLLPIIDQLENEVNAALEKTKEAQN